MNWDYIQTLLPFSPIIKSVKLPKTLDFFNFKINISRPNYLEVTATIIAKILANLHKTSFNPICLSFQPPASAKNKFAEVKNIQNINFKPLSIFCSSTIAVFFKLLDFDQCLLGEQRIMLLLTLVARKSPEFPVNFTKKSNFATSNKNAHFRLPVIIPLTLANAALFTVTN